MAADLVHLTALPTEVLALESFPSIDAMFLGNVDEYRGARYSSGVGEVPAGARDVRFDALRCEFPRGLAQDALERGLGGAFGGAFRFGPAGCSSHGAGFYRAM